MNMKIMTILLNEKYEPFEDKIDIEYNDHKDNDMEMDDNYERDVYYESGNQYKIDSYQNIFDFNYENQISLIIDRLEKQDIQNKKCIDYLNKEIEKLKEKVNNHEQEREKVNKNIAEEKLLRKAAEKAENQEKEVIKETNNKYESYAEVLNKKSYLIMLEKDKNNEEMTEINNKSLKVMNFNKYNNSKTNEDKLTLPIGIVKSAQMYIKIII